MKQLCLLILITFISSIGLAQAYISLAPGVSNNPGMAQDRLAGAGMAGADPGLAAADAGLALVGATVYPSPSAPPLSDVVVLIREGKIVAVGNAGSVKVPKGMKVLNCKGLVLTAGFWNSHVHFIEPKWQHADSLPASRLSAQLDEMFNRYGFTHVYELATFDLKNLLALRARIESGEIGGPAILVAAPFVPVGGSPVYIRPLTLPEIGSPQEATDYVNDQIRAGADAIKLWSSSPARPGVLVNMPMEIAKAAVVAAHRAGKPVFAHPSSDSGIVIAVESGVDVLAHTDPFGSAPWSTEMIQRMLTHKTALTPTLKLWTYEMGRAHLPAGDSMAILATALRQLGAYSKAGGDVLFGTDVGYVPDYSPVMEYQLMSKAGMSFADILTSLTTAPARRFGKAGETGRIEPGSVADLVLLGSDPKKDIRAFADVRYTIRKGAIIYIRKAD